MLSPINYFPECEAICGKVLDHNDELPNEKLTSSFENTQKTWKKRYGTEMVTTKKKTTKMIQVLLIHHVLVVVLVMVIIMIIWNILLWNLG